MRNVLIPHDLPVALRIADVAHLRVHALGGETMGTTWSVKLVTAVDRPLDPVRACVTRVLDRIVQQMSTWLVDSDISRFNRAPPGVWHELPDDFFAVLCSALRIAGETAGAFDPTLGGLVDLWGFGPSGRIVSPPGAEAITSRPAGWSRLRLRDPHRALQPGALQLDLSGIAKGYAVDRVSAALAALGLSDHLVEIGGELRGSGLKPDGTPWWVALEGHASIPETVVALYGQSVATSGDSQRSFIHAGRRWSHTIDPRTGYPVSDRLAAVTVLHRDCMSADALATALTVMGPEDGFAYAVKTDLAARFLVRTAGGMEECVTPAFARMLD